MLVIDFRTLTVPDVDEWIAQIRIAVVAALPALGEALVEHCVSCFERGVDPWGATWAPLADSTLEALAREAAGPTRVRRNFIGPLRRGERATRDRQWTRARSERASRAVFGKKILVDRGFLRNSLHWYIAPGDNGDAVVRVAVGGPAAAYAGVHQWGSKDGSTPARPYLPLIGDPGNPTVQLPPELEAEMHALLQAAVDRKVAELNAQRSAAPATGTGG